MADLTGDGFLEVIADRVSEAKLRAVVFELSKSRLESDVAHLPRDADAVRAGKETLNNSALVDVATGLAQEAEITRALLGSPNQLEAISAHFERRAPVFQDN